jgi:ADP-ribose pyrophosphatase YjhB (NUDIX family)
VAVINGQREFLLQKRYDGQWGVPGGFIDLGESAEEAGRREVLEETGLEIGKLNLVGVFSGKQHYVKLPMEMSFIQLLLPMQRKKSLVASSNRKGLKQPKLAFLV